MIEKATIHILESDRQKAILERDNGNMSTYCCIVNQAIKRQFPVVNPDSVRVFVVDAVIDGVRYLLDNNAKDLTTIHKDDWETAQLPFAITLELV